MSKHAKAFGMKVFTTVMLVFISMIVFGQRQFSVVCNTQTNTLEVVISGQELPHQNVIKDKFPNQRAAEAYLNDNAATIQCGPKPQQPKPAGPPPKATPSPNASPQPSGGQQTASGGFLRRGATKYDRTFRIMASASNMLNLERLYAENVTSAQQQLGYDLGCDLTFGNTVKGGIGFHYTSLFGTFEEILLDEEFDYPDLYGSLSAFKGELVIRGPFQLGKHSWGIFDFGFGYYFGVDLSVEEDIANLLLPKINDGFYGLRWGIGFDIHRFIMQLDGEFVYDISDDRDKAVFLLKFGVGYAF